MQSTSGTNSDGYVVSRISPCCVVCRGTLSPSHLVCTQEECKFLCVHMYMCDPLCYDFNNGHLCKHIHCVHSLDLQNKPHRPSDSHDGVDAAGDDLDQNSDSAYGGHMQNHADHHLKVIFKLGQS